MSSELKTEKRIEEKFFLPKQKLYNFLSIINILEAKQTYPKRTVQSLYMDFNNICYNDHIEGLFDRKKIRFRWYNYDNSKTVLEIKKKISIYTQKIKYKVNKFSPDKKDVFDMLKQSNFWEISSLLPSCYIFYDRNYYNICNDKVRITIDDNLRYGSSNTLMNKLDINSYIVEIKYTNIRDVNLLYLMLNKININLCKISKYVICKERV